ncbi:hypothetical protein [Virgibacillus profundi]|nr:hypothetical protein [Virgibacillus profundi]
MKKLLFGVLLSFSFLFFILSNPIGADAASKSTVQIHMSDVSQ